MSLLPERMRGLIKRTGDSFTMSSVARIGVFRVISYGRALVYATIAEADTYAKPIRLITVPHDDPTAVGDSVSWDGLSLVVKKSVKVRVRGETVARHLLVA